MYWIQYYDQQIFFNLYSNLPWRNKNGIVTNPVAHCLSDMFTLFGVTKWLRSWIQSPNYRFFKRNVVWLLGVTNDKSRRHSQSRGSVDWANRDIENMTITRMSNNTTTKWSEGLRFVECLKNTAYRRGIGRSLIRPKVGISPDTLDIVSKVLVHNQKCRG